MLNRQVNPVLSALIANMSQSMANQRPNIGAGGAIPQAPNPLAGVSQAPIQQPPQGLLSGGNPMQLMQMIKMMEGIKGSMPANTGPISPGGFGGDVPGIMNKFAGAIPTPDFSKFELPPSYKFFMPGGGFGSGY